MISTILLTTLLVCFPASNLILPNADDRTTFRTPVADPDQTSPVENAKTRNHNSGLFLRVSIGIAHGEDKDTAPPSDDPLYWYDEPLSGSLKTHNVALGFFISPNLAIHASSWGSFLSDIGYAGWGLGFTGYLMPANGYATASVGIIPQNWTSYSYTTGFSFDLMVGKEWWISRNWGAGVGLCYGHHSVDSWSSTYYGLRLSLSN